MAVFLLTCFYLFVSFLGCIQAQPQLTCPSTYCVSVPTDCTCGVTGGTLGWTIFYPNGSEAGALGHSLSFSNDNLNNPYSVVDGFTSTLTAIGGSGTNATLSFTPVGAFQNYVIRCLDGGTTLSVNRTINITDSPTIQLATPSPMALSFTSVRFSWSPISIPCMDGYTVMITGGTNSPELITTSSTNIIITNRMRGTVYQFSVAVMDTGNRLGPYSDNTSLELEVPEAPVLITTRPESTDSDTANIFLEWMQPSSYRPPVMEYQVIYNETTTTLPVPTPVITTTLTLTGLIPGSEYTVEVLASNVLGNGPAVSSVIDIPYTPPPPPPPSSSMATPSVSPPPSDTTTKGIPPGVIVAICIGVIFIIILITVAIVILVYCCVCRDRKKNVVPEKKNNNNDDNQLNYAEVEHNNSGKKSSKKSAPPKPAKNHEAVTYSAVQHSQAPQTEYAELAVSTGTGKRTALPQNTIEYAAIRPS